MDFLIDNPETEKIFKQILLAIPTMKNGVIADAMENRGIKYEKNWGASTVDLKRYAAQFEKNHLLALKLWNKQWRETMILATLLDDPKEINEEQMDFWVKTAENIEIVEQAILNVFTETPYAFVKALEWCRGKKQLVKSAGLLMMGRLALTSKNDIDEMFETFFEVLPPLAKDSKLYNIFYRSVCQLARRSKSLHEQCVSFSISLQQMSEENSQRIGNEIHQEITNPDFLNLIKA